MHQVRKPEPTAKVERAVTETRRVTVPGTVAGSDISRGSSHYIIHMFNHGAQDAVNLQDGGPALTASIWIILYLFLS